MLTISYYIVFPLLYRLSSNCELRSSRGTFYFDDHLDLARKPSHTANSNFYIHDINAESSTNSQTNNEVSHFHGLTSRFTDLENSMPIACSEFLSNFSAFLIPIVCAYKSSVKRNAQIKKPLKIKDSNINEE